jgi:outer membrane protein assembly factor BamB
MADQAPRRDPATAVPIDAATPTRIVDPAPAITDAVCAVDPNVHGPVGPPLARWRIETDGVISSAAAVIDGVLFVANWRGDLYAVDAQTGSERWRASLGSLIAESPIAGAGLVYVGLNDGSVAAVDAATGRLRWRVETAGHPAAPVLAGDALLVVSGADALVPAVTGDTVYVSRGNDELSVQALDASTGSERWRVHLTKRGLSALDVGAGAERWHFRTKPGVHAPPVLDGGWIYIADEALHQVNVETGVEHWQTSLPEHSIVREMAVGELVYLIVDESRDVVEQTLTSTRVVSWLYAFDDASGAERWRISTGGSNASAPVVANDAIFIGGVDGGLNAVDAMTGDQRWRLEIGGQLATPLVACSTLFVGTYRGSLVAVANS